MNPRWPRRGWSRFQSLDGESDQVAKVSQARDPVRLMEYSHMTSERADTIRCSQNA